MSNDNQFAISSPYFIFYVESILTITSSALVSMEEFVELLDGQIAGQSGGEEQMINHLQNITNQSAALSKYFWPVPGKATREGRGAFLRKKFNIPDSSPLADRAVRNAIEHFDERLDKFTSTTIVGNIIPTYVGLRIESKGIPLHIFRAYYTNEKKFAVLDVEYEIEPVFNEILRLHSEASALRK